MKALLIVAIIILFIGVLAYGCSAGNGLLSPEAPKGLVAEAQDESSWGAYELYINAETSEVQVSQVHTAQPHFDVTDYILPPLCSDCVGGNVLGFDTDTRIMTLEISLTNPTDYYAYDVRGILIQDPAIGHEITNPDGYTKRFDDSDPKDINPFIYWRTGGSEMQFPPQTTLTQTVQVKMPAPMSFAIQFVVDASFPGHSRDPLQFTSVNLVGNIHDTGWLADLSVEVSVWQNDVAGVYVDLSPFGTGNGEVPLTLDVDGLWKGQIVYNPNMGYTLPELGNYKLILRAQDLVSPQNLYDYIDVTVTEDTSPPEWVNHVGISGVAMGAGRAVVAHGEAVDPSADVEYYLYYSQSSDPFAGDYVTVTGMGHYAITGLTNGAEYVFGVRAGDQAGNVDDNLNYRVGTPAALQLLWAKTVAAEINSDPNAADLDGDSDLDVVFGCDDGKVVVVDGSTGNIGWYLQTGGSVISSPALVDINLDGLPDVVIGSGDGKLYGIRGTNGTNLGAFQTQGIIESSPVIVDYDSNGTPEVFFASHDGKVYGLSILTMVHFATFVAGNQIAATPCLSYINADEYVDVVVAAGGSVYAVNGTDATALWTQSVGLSGPKGSPAMADFNGDVLMDVAVGTSSGVYAFNGLDGTLLWSNTSLGVDLDTSPALGDINLDGVPDVVISGRTQGIYAFDGTDGHLLWQAEGNPVVAQSPAIADVTGDGFLDVITGSADLSLKIYSGADGLILGTFATGLAGAVTTTPVIADINHDGYIDIVFGTEEMTIMAITTNQAVPASVNLLPWPRFHRNILNQGNLGAALVPQW